MKNTVMRNTLHKHSGGFSLIELMTVVVVIGVLMSVAIPSYRAYTVRTARAEAQWNLLKLAGAQEQFYLGNNTYATNSELDAAPPAGLGMTAGVTHTGKYLVRINSADASGFVAEVVAQGAQATDDTKCKHFTINERGARYGGPGPITTISTHDPDCWGN